jgi:hypothetical protein
LSVIVAGFSLHCKSKFSVETVQIVRFDGQKDQTPQLQTRVVPTSTGYLNKLAGINLSREEIVANLAKMGLLCVGGAGQELEFEIPHYRSGTPALSPRHPPPLRHRRGSRHRLRLQQYRPHAAARQHRRQASRF